MKYPIIMFVGAMTLLSACNTHPKENYQQAYEQSLVDGNVTMLILRSLDAGDARKTRRVAMTSLHVALDSLPRYAAQAHPTPEQKQETIALARDVLDYMQIHCVDFDPRLPSVQCSMRGLKKILTEPDDVRRLTELTDYYADVEKKLSEAQKP